MSAIFFSTTNLINYDDPAIQKTDQKAYIHIAENGFGKVEENGKVVFTVTSSGHIILKDGASCFSRSSF